MTSYANRGRPLEELVMRANETYKKRQIAVIEKVPTEWIPLRNGKGKIVSAKVEHKAIVDFLGSYNARPIAFDAKLVSRTASQKGDRISLGEIQDHQERFLRYWTRDGSPGFVLVSFDLRRFFVVAWHFWAARLIAARAKTGPASVTLALLEEMSMATGYPKSVAEVKQTPGIPLDYLAGVYDLFFERRLASGQPVW